MRIVIDMQGAQSVGTRNRGVGRYTVAITKALLRNRGGHHIVLALNGNFADTIIPLCTAFDGMLLPEHIHIWHLSTPTSCIDTANRWRSDTAELTYESFLASLKPDFVFITSLFEGLVDNTVVSIHRLLRSAPVAVVLYDLIPYLYPDPYLENPAVKDWYLEKIEHLRKADLWLAISESSRHDGITQLDLPEEWTVNIGTDADALFQIVPISTDREAILRTQYGLSRPFVLYTGGIDHRKNIEALIRAFAQLPEPLRNAHQLAIVCSIQPADRERLMHLVRQHGLNEQGVVLTGFVPDADMLAFYNLCQLFVFPSWYEGFGLPALEAMRCGAPVIGANTSSLPEVIGLNEALFDPYSDEAIARMLERGLTDEVFHQTLLEHGKKQACKFSWDDSVRRAIAAMERKHEQWERAAASIQVQARPKLAYVSPLRPMCSGIADYSAELLPELGKLYDIDVIVEQDDITDSWVKENCHIRTSQWLRQNDRQYDRVLYHFGNSEFHQHMFQLLEDVPGVVVLHDFYLSGILAHMEMNNPTAGIWLQALYKSHGHVALYEHQHAKDLSDIIWKYPCNLGVIQDSLGVIVHSANSLRLASRWYAADVCDWSVIPLVRNICQTYERDEARQMLGLKDDDFLVCTFGMIGPIKLNHRLLHAWQQSSLARRSSCRLVFVGKNHPGEYGQSLLESIKTHQKGSQVSITDWVDMAEFHRYLAAADVCVQLRTLSRGETSAAVLDCMNYAKPTIVNANGSMTDLNPEAVLILPDEFTDKELVQALETLYKDASLRQQLGAVARNTIVSQHNPAACAERYRDVIEGYYRHAEAHVSTLASTIADQQTEIVNDTKLIPLAAAVARNLPPSHRLWQLLVDVSMLMDPSKEYALMPQLKAWLESPPYGCRVEPVYFVEHEGYHYARNSAADFLGYETILSDDPIEYWAGDVFIKAGLISESISLYQKNIHEDMLRSGVALRLLPTANSPLRHKCQVKPELSEILERLNKSNKLSCTEKQLFIDVSELIGVDTKSGIQRVVRSVLFELSKKKHPEFRVEVIYSIPGHQGYFYAKHLFVSGINEFCSAWSDGAIAFQEGDIFLGLDLNHQVVASNAEFYHELRRCGIRVEFILYDLLPVLHPEFFISTAYRLHEKWLKVLAQSDGVICISKSVAVELRKWLNDRDLLRSEFRIDWFHLGADINASIPSQGKPDNAENFLSRITENNTFLMIGTLEPRKGYQQVLAAFESLWAKKVQINLVIVGKQGWMMERFIEKMQKCPEFGSRLFWVDSASDEYLEEIYSASTCLIAASEGEGFGLPLIEAAQHKLPIIARDIAVFREIAGDNAFYFSGKGAGDLGYIIEQWLELYQKGCIPDSSQITWLTWAQSTEILISKLLG